MGDSETRGGFAIMGLVGPGSKRGKGAIERDWGSKGGGMREVKRKGRKVSKKSSGRTPPVSKERRTKVSERWPVSP